MIIVLGNQKGGAGKSTLAILCANYFSIVKKKKVIVLDMDYQSSIYNRFEEDKILDNEPPYEVVELSLDKFSNVASILKEDKELTIIIDLPGKLDDENLLPIFKTADAFIIPFCYDKLTYQATTVFNLILSEINKKGKRFFIPNRIKGNVKYDILEAVNSDFNQYGTVTPIINDSINFQRLTTRELSENVTEIIEPVFESIISNLYE